MDNMTALHTPLTHDELVISNMCVPPHHQPHHHHHMDEQSVDHCHLVLSFDNNSVDPLSF
jgi:hypothetical protein